MKSPIKSLILMASVALCLMIVPAFSTSSDNNYCPSSAGCKIPGGMGYDDKIGFGHLGGCTGHFDANSSENESALLAIPIYYSGSGFAMNDSQYHALKMTIFSIAKLSPEKINNLISDNKTLAKIKSDIETEVYAEIDASPHNGSMILGEGFYKLSNIKPKTTSDDNSTMEADVAGPITLANLNNTAAVAGHLSMAITNHEGSFVGQGKLIMNSGNFSGKYDVLIKMGSDKREFSKGMNG